MSPINKFAAFVGVVVTLVLCVAPVASAHTPTLVAGLDCNGKVSWTFGSDGFAAHFTISDGVYGQQGGTMSIGAPGYSASGSYTVPSSVTTGSVTVHISWDDGYTGESVVTVAYAQPGCKSSPTVSTNLSSPSITAGSSAHDSAVLTGASAHAGGSVVYTVYPSLASCVAGTGGTAAGTKQVTNGLVPDSDPVAFAAVGSYYWQAAYSGDGSNFGASSPCSSELLVVNPTASTLTTQVSAASLALGAAAHDTAALTGATSNAGGTISYALYGGSACGTAIANLTPSPNTVVNGVVPPSSSFTFTSAGTFYFVATYSGDANNAGPVSSGCSAEPLTVSKAATTTVTNIKQAGSTVTSITSGSSVTDVATVSGQVGAIAPTGTVSFSFYSTANCTGASTSAGTPALAAGSATSSSEGPLSAGSYSFQATYNGDANYIASTGACEPLTVSSPPTGGTPAISITKNPKSQTIASGATANFTIVVTNTGTLTLTNVTVSDPLSPNCNQTSSGIPALASMAPGASVTYNCSLANVTAGFTNLATATGTGSNGQTVTATDSAPVTVTPPVVPPPVVPAPTPHPSIKIVKDPKAQTIGEGGTAHFAITVTNTGDVALSDVTVSDPLSPDCNHSLGTLAVGQSKSFSCARTNVNRSFQNVATATGKPPAGATVQATDHANVTAQPFVPPQHPRISIVKSPKSQTLTTKLRTTASADGASQTTVSYGAAHFTIKVTNTGDVTLHSVTVTDLASPDCSKALGTLASGASKTFSCSRSTVTSSFTNVAVAHGISPKGKHVEDSDHAVVKVTVIKKTTGVGNASAKKVLGKKPVKTPGTVPDTTSSGTAPNFTG